MSVLEEGLAAFRRHNSEGWALAWGIAAELCDRFHASHGLVPHVVIRDGLGYYGIRWEHAACPVHGPERRQLGRMSAGGDVENWITGEPGDHGLEMASQVRAGFRADRLLTGAIAHLGWPPAPIRSHARCRHARDGAAFSLVFRLVARLAIRHDRDTLSVITHPAVLPREVMALRPQAADAEHQGLVMLRNGRSGETLVLSTRGRMLVPDGDSLWQRRMSGEGEDALLARIESVLDLPSPGIAGA